MADKKSKKPAAKKTGKSQTSAGKPTNYYAPTQAPLSATGLAQLASPLATFARPGEVGTFNPPAPVQVPGPGGPSVVARPGVQSPATGPIPAQDPALMQVIGPDSVPAWASVPPPGPTLQYAAPGQGMFPAIAWTVPPAPPAPAPARIEYPQQDVPRPYDPNRQYEIMRREAGAYRQPRTKTQASHPGGIVSDIPRQDAGVGSWAPPPMPASINPMTMSNINESGVRIGMPPIARPAQGPAEFPAEEVIGQLPPPGMGRVDGWTSPKLPYTSPGAIRKPTPGWIPGQHAAAANGAHRYDGVHGLRKPQVAGPSPELLAEMDNNARRADQIRQGFAEDRARASTAAGAQYNPAQVKDGMRVTLPMDDQAAVAQAQANYDAAYRSGDPKKIQAAKDALGQSRMDASQVRTHGFGAGLPRGTVTAQEQAMRQQVDPAAGWAMAGRFGGQTAQGIRDARAAKKNKSDADFVDFLKRAPQDQAASYKLINDRRVAAGLPPLAVPNTKQTEYARMQANRNKAYVANKNQELGRIIQASNMARKYRVPVGMLPPGAIAQAPPPLPPAPPAYY